MLKIKMQAIVLDCNDSHALAEFYATLLSWTKHDENSEWIAVSNSDEMPYLLFQQVPDYKPPIWPDEPEAQRQMLHLDFVVNNLEDALNHALNCGARIAPIQFSEQWKVMIDPAGHPFCLLQQDWL